ncbi:SAM-dependent methyltransferase [Actinoalloteichus hoggarensis]|uniref:Ubiquinone biosynthesis O-methyltransferase n=1 Tax=Actinoalloteichus hoggarensis TaxID=1470176 RepID=A0A221W595_9PSEU|nr:class I SAM-dependent methyltransferase [Actinoalloteichus hoggarensis]ASO20717.1 Ubiquinone biosynthesis O-methyltransferase [Actinoalloteichus hoggarensis]MBB5924429.1 SAM-dependent methyltransferase [Actinoalloteichus hoggarensis]
MPTTDEVDRSRAAYRADLERGTSRLFHPRGTTCPWCGSTDLRVRLRTTDLLQHKPGRFTLDECGGCRHVFQNPRLTPEGLDFYYRDFYDGLAAERMDRQLEKEAGAHQARAEVLLPHASPKSWLDVGTSHGHFCQAAAELFPDTEFDGLDLGEGVELGRRQGRIKHAYQGQFVDLADELTGRYDVVSMFHYLEHSAEPKPELRAAHQALRPGGHLLIDVPDPECRFARLLGRYWIGWTQPQHLHFIPPANLRAELHRAGFDVVVVQRAEAHLPCDLAAAAWLFVNHLAPRQDRPWLFDRPGPLRRAGRLATLIGGAPLMLGGMLLDRLVAPVADRLRLTNSYRVLAVRR